MEPILRFYNSRTKSVVNFNFNKNETINIYTCGPTVYDQVHIGNLKTFLLSDFIVSLLHALGYKTNHIMNITDIDDKILSRLPEKSYENLIEYTSYFTNKFLEDIEKLGLINYKKENIYKVTETIEKIEEMILDLVEKKIAYYTTDGSIYFDTIKNLVDNPFHRDCDISHYESDRKIIRAEGIRNPTDFVLWKSRKDYTFSMNKKIETKGFPGWHIECSAICAKVLDKVHIKMGAIDLKSPHHECEIYQSESYKPNQIYGDYWIHFGFLNFAGDKMSKSIGNVLKLDDIKQNYKLVRMYLLMKSYKNDVEYNEDEIETLKTDFINLHLLYNKLHLKTYRQHKKSELNYSSSTMIYNEILGIIANNIDTQNGFRRLFEYVNRIMKVYLSDEKANEILMELDKVNKLFNIIDYSLLEIDEETKEFLNEREKLRELKQFDRTDEMREKLKLSFIFEDEKTGYSIIKKL